MTFTVHKSCQVTSYTTAWLDSISRCIVPFVLLLIVNIKVIYLYHQNQKDRKDLISSTKAKADKNKEKVLTIILLTASFSYLLFNLPYISYILLMPALRYTYSDGTVISYAYWDHECMKTGIECSDRRYDDFKIVDDSGEDRGIYIADMYLWYVISICFMYINNSINFYLYCLGGPTFRKEFTAMMSCCKPSCCDG